MKDILLKRTASGPEISVLHRVVRHSPTGMLWGYGGSGPADLALNILLAAGLPLKKADGLYQDFKWEVVARIPYEGKVLRGAAVQAWIADRTGAWEAKPGRLAAVGSFVKTWFDTGAMGMQPMYGVVTGSGPASMNVEWRSGSRCRIPQGGGRGCEPVKDRFEQNCALESWGLKISA